MKKVIIALCVAIAVLIVAVCDSGKRHKKEMAVYMDYAEVCESFIQKYIKEVSGLRDYVYRDESVDSLIMIVDAIGFEFAEKTELVEYNLYAFDRNLYWDKTYNQN